MGMRFSWDELNDSSEQTGNAVGDFAKNLAKGTKNFACSLYRNYPYNFIRNPGSALLKGMWDSICEPPFEPPPSPPFSGGQCVGVQYLVNFLRNDNGATSGTPYISGAVYSYGPVTIFSRPQGTDGLGNQQYLAYIGAPGSAGTAIIFYSQISQSNAVRITSVSRVDGQPDNCGDPPVAYPPPANIPSNQRNTTINITNNVGTSINVPVSLIDANVNLNIPIAIDVGGLKVYFDIGGVNIYSPSEDPYDRTSPNPPTITPTPDDWILPPPPLGDSRNNINLQLSIDNSRVSINSNTDTKIDASVSILSQLINNFSSTFNQKNDVNLSLSNQINTKVTYIKNLLDNATEDGKEIGEKLVTIEIPTGTCQEGIWTQQTESIQVAERIAPAVLKLFQEIESAQSKLCESELNKVVGVPLPYYSESVDECLVLYYSYTPPRAVTIGRYLSIPNPNVEKALEEVLTIPNYRPGVFTCYTQYLSSKGNKIQVYGRNLAEVTAYRALLESYTNFTESQVYNRSVPRQVQSGALLDLRLKRMTYFEKTRDRYSGNDSGRIIWERSY